MGKRIIIFASGNGSNAENIISYFKEKNTAEIILVVSNKADAKVLERAKKNKVASLFVPKEEVATSAKFLEILKDLEPDLIVLSGFLLKFPLHILKVFENMVINIHPALLPKYGGKGMYGKHVHQAVYDASEKETGITIHYVNENYDEGAIIFQKSVELSEKDTPVVIAEKIQKLEQEYFPKVIEKLLLVEKK